MTEEAAPITTEVSIDQIVVGTPAVDPEGLTRVAMAPRLKAFRNELVALAKKYGNHDPERMLAVAAHATGTLLATLSPAKTSAAKADAIVRVNIKGGHLKSLTELHQVEKLG